MRAGPNQAGRLGSGNARERQMRQKVLVIDDSKPNVDAARDVGMHAIHCVEPIDLAAELRGYGFPV